MPRVPTAERYEGKPCHTCGGTTRYASSCHCVTCSNRWSKAAGAIIKSKFEFPQFFDEPVSPRFCRPDWFDEPPPEQMARARPGLAAGGRLRGAACYRSGT